MDADEKLKSRAKLSLFQKTKIQKGDNMSATGKVTPSSIEVEGKLLTRGGSLNYRWDEDVPITFHGHMPFFPTLSAKSMSTAAQLTSEARPATILAVAFKKFYERMRPPQQASEAGQLLLLLTN